MQGTSVIVQSAWLKYSVVVVAVVLTGCGGSSSSGSAQPSKIDRVTPTRAIVNVPSEFSLEGDAATLAAANLSVSVTNCKGIKINSKTAGRLIFGCTPEREGNQTLQLKNAQGAVLYQTQLSFALKPYIASVTPTQMEVNTPTTFVMTGINLGLGLSLPTLTGCQNLTKVSESNTQYQFSCTPTAEGSQSLVVKDVAQEEVYRTNINVRPRVVIDQVLLSTSNVSVGQLTTFTLKGRNFINQANVAMTGCNSDLVVHSRSLTEIRFSCTPMEVGAQQIQLKDDSPYIFASRAVTVEPFATRKSRWYASGINTCATETQNGLLCSAAALGELFGLKQDGEDKIGVLTEYKLVTKVVISPDDPAIVDAEKCIKDVYTGLVWEQKTNDGGLRDKDWTYTWYEPNGNFNGSGKGGEENPEFPAAGSVGTTATCQGLFDTSTPPKAQVCNTQTYINYLNKIEYCGYKTWRLPHVLELETLVNLSRSSPAIHAKSYFANTASTAYWSLVPAAEPLSQAWVVDFATGESLTRPKAQAYAIRAVAR